MPANGMMVAATLRFVLPGVQPLRARLGALRQRQADQHQRCAEQQREQHTGHRRGTRGGQPAQLAIAARRHRGTATAGRGAI